MPKYPDWNALPGREAEQIAAGRLSAEAFIQSMGNLPFDARVHALIIELIDTVSSISGANLLSGNGSPEGTVTADPGSVYLQLDTGPNVHPWWTKRSGTGNTGWRGVAGFAVGVSSMLIARDGIEAELPANTMQLGGGSEVVDIYQYRFGNEFRFWNIAVPPILMYWGDADDFTDQDASPVHFEAPRGRGTGIPGEFVFRVSSPDPTGDTLQTLADAVTIAHDKVTIHKPLEMLGGSSSVAGATELTHAVVQLIKDPGAATITGIGMPDPTVTLGINNDLQDQRLVGFQTNASTGSVAGIGPNYIGEFGWNPDATWRIRTSSDITTVRFWVGLTTSSLSSKDAPTTEACAMFRYSTAVDGTAFWRCVSHDGGATPTVTTTSVAVATTTAYTFRIVRSADATVEFYINGSLVATHADAGSAVPTNAQDANNSVVVTTLANASRTLSFSRAAFLFPDQ